MYELSTITEICNDYLTEKRERRKPDTVYGYESSINRHVLPRWGALRVSEITRKDVQAWVDELTPLRGPSGAEKAYKCLRQIIRWAIDRLHTIWVERGRPKGRIIGNAKPMRVAWAIKLHAIKNRLPWVGMRNLRHTWATLAIKAGAAIEHVAEMMGHSNIQTCYRYYMEITAATKRRVQRRLARLVLGKSCDDMYKGIIPPQPAPQPARELPMAA